MQKAVNYKKPEWRAPYREVTLSGGEIVHVYRDKEDAEMHSHDYLYAGWFLTSYEGDNNAWMLKVVPPVMPSVMAGGWAR